MNYELRHEEKCETCLYYLDLHGPVGYGECCCAHSPNRNKVRPAESPPCDFYVYMKNGFIDDKKK